MANNLLLLIEFLQFEIVKAYNKDIENLKLLQIDCSSCCQGRWMWTDLLIKLIPEADTKVLVVTYSQSLTLYNLILF